MKAVFKLVTGCLIIALIATTLAGCGGKKRKPKEDPVGANVMVTSDGEFDSWKENTSIRAAIESGQYDQARQQILNRLDSNPDDARAHYLMGQSYLKEGKYNRARRSLEKACEIEPENRNYSRELGHCLTKNAEQQIEQDMPSEAIANLKMAMNYGFQPGQTEEKLAFAYQQTADQLIYSGNTVEAENLLREALSMLPDRPSLRVKLAELLIEADRLMEAERLLKSLSETNPDFEQGLTAYAELLYRMGEVKSAAAMVERALSIAPAHPEALRLKAMLNRNIEVVNPPTQELITVQAAREMLDQLEESGQFSQQKQVLERLLNQYPGESWAYLRLSRINESLELYDEALINVRKFLNSEPDSTAGNFQLAKILRQNGDYEAALLLLQQIENSNEDKVTLLNEKGQVEARMGRFSEAEALWQRALAIDPQNADSLFNLGQLAMETGKADQAQEYFERALRISPFNAKYKYFAGLNLIQSGLKNQAHSFWASGREQLNAEDPYARRILKALGEPQTNGRQADIADATTEMPVVHVPTSVIEEGPEDPDYTRALAYARAGYFNEAINGFRQVLLRNPSNFNALMNLGKVHAISGNAARSCALYLKALKLNPKNIFALRALANAYSETGLHSFAASITSQAEETHAGQTDGFPDYKASPAAVRNNPRAFKPVVTALLAEGLAHEAMAVIQSGLAQQQESAEMLLLKGDVDKELGRYDTALDAYRQAMSMEPQNPLPYLKTGDLLIAAGQFTNAADEYHKALKAGFIDPDTMFEIVDRFKQLGRSSDARRVLGRLKGMNLNQSQIAKLETHLGEQIEISQEDN